MGRRPSTGPRSTSQSSGLRHYFLRSNASTADLIIAETTSSSLASPVCEDSQLPSVERVLKKKPSLWSMFGRASRKTSETSVNPKAGLEVSWPMTRAATLQIEFTASTRRSSIDRTSPSSQSDNSISSDELLVGASRPPPGRVLRSQRSLQTLHSHVSIPALKSARSHYTLRRPSGLHFDSDSVFSDDSDEVSVSWVTSTGRRRVGLDFEDDDEEMPDIRR